jgi:hypothetical protein
MHRSRSSEQCTFWKFEILADLSFLLSPKYNEFRIDFLHTSRSHNCLSQDFLFWIFWIFQILFLIFFKKGYMELELHISTLISKPKTNIESTCRHGSFLKPTNESLERSEINNSWIPIYSISRAPRTLHAEVKQWKCRVTYAPAFVRFHHEKNKTILARGFRVPLDWRNFVGIFVGFNQ